MSEEREPASPGISDEEFDKWLKQRNEAIDKADIPANVKEYMKDEDFGEGEDMPFPESQAVRDAKDIEERARAGRRQDEKGHNAPTETGAPAQPGRDIPLEFGLDPFEELGPTRHDINFTPVTPSVHLKTAQARAAGYSWDAINGHLAEQQARATAAGYSPGQIASHLGYRLGPLHDDLMATAQRAAASSG